MNKKQTCLIKNWCKCMERAGPFERKVDLYFATKSKYQLVEEVLDIDFSDINNIKPDGRILRVGFDCPTCGGKMVRGSTFTDYRTTGSELIDSAVKVVQGRLKYNKQKAENIVSEIIEKYKNEGRL